MIMKNYYGMLFAVAYLMSCDNNAKPSIEGTWSCVEGEDRVRSERIEKYGVEDDNLFEATEHISFAGNMITSIHERGVYQVTGNEIVISKHSVDMGADLNKTVNNALSNNTGNGSTDTPNLNKKIITLNDSILIYEYLGEQKKFIRKIE